MHLTTAIYNNINWILSHRSSHWAQYSIGKNVFWAKLGRIYKTFHAMGVYISPLCIAYIIYLVALHVPREPFPPKRVSWSIARYFYDYFFLNTHRNKWIVRIFLNEANTASTHVFILGNSFWGRMLLAWIILWILLQHVNHGQFGGCVSRVKDRLIDPPAMSINSLVHRIKQTLLGNLSIFVVKWMINCDSHGEGST